MSDPLQATTCYRHPDRPAGVRCQRCDRVICPACMNTASVGFHCPECVKSQGQRVVTMNTLFGRPWLTQLLIGVNVAIFVLSLITGDSLARRRVSSDGLLEDGGLAGIFVDVDGEWWRLFTSGFLHLGLLHIGLNMYALWILGTHLEPRIGVPKFAALYASSLLAGSFGAVLVKPNALTVGASGAIYGLLGATIVSQRSAGIDIWRSGLGTVMIINLALTFGIPGISIGGHIGGLIGGLAGGWLVFELPKRVKVPKGTIVGLMVALGALAFIGGLWASTTWTDPIF